MYVGRDYDVTTQGENEIYRINFVNDLPDGDSVAAVTFSLSVVEGIDPNPTSHLDGLPGIIDGIIVAQRLNGLLGGVNYLLKATVTTTQGNTLILYSHARCEVAS